MSKDKSKAQNAKPQSVKTPVVKPVPIIVPPLFRKIDWLVLGITFAAVWTTYLFTLAPELTLEDCGELCTASFYAGIPHPPGYPFWTIYSWLWTAIVPFGNVAWRVELGESFAAAMACGLVGFMVSRGSSMLIEGIEELKSMEREWENAICIVTGIVAGLMLGFDGFLWKESVVINRISPFDVPWLMVVALCLLRWIYAPHQRRYLYIGMFFFGLCATIHQTMLVAAMGIEVCIAFALPRLGRDLLLGNSIIYALGLAAMATGKIPALNDLSPMFIAIFHVVGLGSITAGVWLSFSTRAIGTEWKAVVFMGLLWLLGAAFYFYEPLAGMTDPPMQWGYPRTVEGFFHALSRGQYEKANPTDIIHDPMRFIGQLWQQMNWLAESFSWVSIFIALLPFLFLFKMKNRERAWIIGLASIYFCVGVLLTIIMNTTPDRTGDENRAFFTASHAVVAIMIGYGLALMAAHMATHYEKFRRWGFAGSVVATLLAFFCLSDATGKLYFGPAGQVGFFELPHWIAQAFTKDQYGLPVFANLILLAVPIIFIIALVVYRQRGPVLILLCLLLAMPVWSGLSHWYKSEQRNHWFGYWFGHDMFTPPFAIYPEMSRNTILFGGTDPGRFCPTYMIFCESFIPHRCQPYLDQKFDRRDVYLITQNALADGTYLDYLRAQYYRSQQKDPPFFSRFFRYIAAMVTGSSANVIMDLNNSDVGKGDTGNALIEGVASLLYKTLDVPFTALGAKIEARRRAQGVYPPNEIYIPSDEDSKDCFQRYTDDVARRQQLGQLKPGEDVHIDADGRVQVSGQVAVMEINGLLCEVIFQKNPTNDFYVEESFPLDWMYPYETPSGIIMKINRDPLPELTDDVFKKDHQFWSKYSDRLIGNWITYDTTVQEITDFAQKVYLGNNYAGFKGDRKFVRDDDAQKAFSKLRSSIAGMYAWRCGFPEPGSGTISCPPEYRQKTEAAQNALIRETDFAFKQAFAFCPYSPEAVFRYVNFLLQLNRLDDALMVAETCLKLDPFNDQVKGTVAQLQEFKKREAANAQLQSMQSEAITNPTDFKNILTLGGIYAQMQDTNRAFGLLRQSVGFFDRELARPDARPDNITAMAQICAAIGDLPELEIVLQKLVALQPDQPEARYDLAALEAFTGKTNDALKNLGISIDLSSKRLLTNPAARNLANEARNDQRFNAIRNLPEFQKLVPPG
jgi:thioredoxin-like negative regulator of GroEL